MKSFTREHYIGEGAIVAKEKTICGEYFPHRHEFYEIEYILSGSGEYRVDDKVWEIRPGMLFFMTPFHFHSVTTPGCRLYNVMFSEELCDAGFLIRLLHASTALARESENGFFQTTLRELTAADRTDPVTVYLLNALLGTLAARQAPSPTVGTPVKDAMLYLLHHFRESPSLSAVSAHVGYAPSYFSALFKEEVGVGFKEYLDRLRFDYAKKLLCYSGCSVMEACSECGFEDYPNFIRRFKRRFGCSPSQLNEKEHASDPSD